MSTPFGDPDASDLVCARCDRPLEMLKVEASYLGQTFPVDQAEGYTQPGKASRDGQSGRAGADHQDRLQRIKGPFPNSAPPVPGPLAAPR